MLDRLDARGILRWLSVASAAVDAERETIDALNVFPVADNDTGTNLGVTLAGAVEAASQLIDADRFTAGRFVDDRAGADRCAEGSPAGVRAVAQAAARGAAVHARGNSGVILAQLLRGFADAVPVAPNGCPPNAAVTGPDVAGALVAAADRGYEAVADPVEGTVLSVARAAGQAAAAAARAGRPAREVGPGRRAPASLLMVTTAAVTAGQAALARTTSQLPALAAAGVVDAGGYGFVLVLEALSAAVGGPARPSAAVGSPIHPRIGPPVDSPIDRAARAVTAAPGAPGERPAGQGPAYEVQYLLDADADRVATLREVLSTLGDSVVIAAIDGASWNVHAHVYDVGAAVEAGVEAGRPHAIRVTRFADAAALTTARTDVASGTPSADARTSAAGPRASSETAASANTTTATPAGPEVATTSTLEAIDPPGGVSIVVVSPGEGLADVFRREGVHVLEPTPGRRLTEADVLAALLGTAVGTAVGTPVGTPVGTAVGTAVGTPVGTPVGNAVDPVVVLPSSVDVWEVAEAAAVAARIEGLIVAVVPIRSPVQGLAAVAVHDPNRRFDDDVIHMAETAASTRWAEITVADREALTMAGHCYPGEVLGLIGGEVVHIGRDVASVAEAVIDRLLGVGGELVTVLVGANVPDGIGSALVAHVHRVAPHVEVSVLVGGQPEHPLLIGVE